MKLLRIYLFVLSAVLSLTAGAATSAGALLDALRVRIVSAPSVEAVFTINGGDGAVQGNVIISGSKYTMSTPQMKAWFDGRTQWTQLTNTKETSITEPDREELMATNPFAILTAHKDYYTARLLKTGATADVVELIPRARTSTIASFSVTISKKTGWPTAVDVKFDDGRRISVRIDSIAAGTRKAASVFRYDPKAYPAFETVDLR